MRTKLKTYLTTATVLAALLAGPILYANADTTASENQDGMMQEGHGDMMAMMQQMSSMMEACNEMMQGMADHGPETQEEEDNSLPESDG